MSLKFSEKFTKVLKRIDYNLVSRHLLNISKYSEDKFDHDYIDISDRNSLVSFTPKSKVEKIMQDLPKVFTTSSVRNLTHSDANDHIFEILGYDKENNPYWYPESEYTKGNVLKECKSPTTGKEYVLFQCIESKRLSVINKVALVQEDNSDMIFQKNRNTIKVGRLANTLLSVVNIEFKAQDIEEFVNLYKSSYDFIDNKGIQFSIVKGDDIAKWYRKENYEEGGGILNNSCMAEKGSEFFELYTKNPNQCSMVLLFSDDGHLKDGKYQSETIKGRALLWDLKHNGEMFKFMDRAYTTHDSDSELFKEWAKENGWLYKENQTMYPDTNIMNGDEVIEGKISIKLDTTETEGYPYMDTLCHWNNGCLTNDSESGHSKEFRTVHGGYIAIDEDGCREEIFTFEREECCEEELDF